MKSYLVKPITPLQYILLIVTFQISVGFLSLPGDLAEFAGTDGWLAIIPGWAVATVAALAIVKVMGYHPEGTVLDLLKRYMGVWAARAAAVVFIAYFLMLAYDGYAITTLVIKLWLLPTTYLYILTMLLMIPTYQIAKHGVQAIGRYSEIVAMMCIALPVLYALTFRFAHWLNLLPILKEGLAPVLIAVKTMIYPMIGMILALFIYPNLNQKKKAASSIVIANTMTCCLYLLVTLVCFVYFSPDEIGKFNNPVITIMKSIEFQFIERIEVPFIAFYLFIFSCIWIPSMYMASYCSAWLFGKGSERVHLAVLCALMVASIVIYRPSYMDMGWLNRYLNGIGFAI